MNQPLQQKLAALKSRIQSLRRLLLAYSGGVDSAFLLKAAHEVLGGGVEAVIARSVIHPTREYERARQTAALIGARLVTIDTEELALPEFSRNAPDRCYHCKKSLFGKLTALARDGGFSRVVDGTNVDDQEDYRPGNQALEELQILSPLKEAGLNKGEIRQLSQAWGLPTWNQPAEACLASRFPYGEVLTAARLIQVEKAEVYLQDQGFRPVRVRCHDQIARIEVLPEEIPRLADKAKQGELIACLKTLGFTYVTIDLEGYRRGSLNQVLTTREEA